MTHFSFDIGLSRERRLLAFAFGKNNEVPRENTQDPLLDADMNEKPEGKKKSVDLQQKEQGEQDRQKASAESKEKQKLSSEQVTNDADALAVEKANVAGKEVEKAFSPIQKTETMVVLSTKEEIKTPQQRMEELEAGATAKERSPDQAV